jgi:hypothetical protein
MTSYRTQISNNPLEITMNNIRYNLSSLMGLRQWSLLKEDKNLLSNIQIPIVINNNQLYNSNKINPKRRVTYGMMKNKKRMASNSSKNNRKSNNKNK